MDNNRPKLIGLTCSSSQVNQIHDETEKTKTKHSISNILVVLATIVTAFLLIPPAIVASQQLTTSPTILFHKHLLGASVCTSTPLENGSPGSFIVSANGAATGVFLYIAGQNVELATAKAGPYSSLITTEKLFLRDSQSHEGALHEYEFFLRYDAKNTTSINITAVADCDWKFLLWGCKKAVWSCLYKGAKRDGVGNYRMELSN